MTMEIAKGAQPILDARMKGQRPADMVMVSLAETIETGNPVVYAIPGKRYDWRWVRGLNVCLNVSGNEDWPDTLLDIARCAPANLELWNRADQWGAHVYLVPTVEDVTKPARHWRMELDFLPWMEFQNKDFIERRRYTRDEFGMPYGI